MNRGGHDSGDISPLKLGNAIYPLIEPMLLKCAQLENRIIYLEQLLRKNEIPFDEPQSSNAGMVENDSKKTIADFIVKTIPNREVFAKRLIDKIKKIVSTQKSHYAREAMLYIYSCEVGNVFGDMQLPYTLVESELGIKKSTYYNRRKGGKNCDYTPDETAAALKYLQS